MISSFRSLVARRSHTLQRSSLLRRQVHVEKRLEELSITLPPAPTPKANYNIVCHANGNILYVSGHLPVQVDGTLMTGRLGAEGRDVKYGYEASRHAGLNIISTLKEELGDLDRVQQIVKVRGRRVSCCVRPDSSTCYSLSGRLTRVCLLPKNCETTCIL